MRDRDDPVLPLVDRFGRLDRGVDVAVVLLAEFLFAAGLLGPGEVGFVDELIELLDLDGRDITDPIGAGPSAYRKSLAQIERAIDARLPGLL